MPPIEDWISLSTILAAGQFAISVWLGFAGIEQMRARRPKISFVLMGLAAILFAAGVYNSAKQEEKNLQTDRLNEAMRSDIAVIRDTVAPPKINTQVTPKSILDLLQAQRNALIAQTKNNFVYMRLVDDEPLLPGGPYKLHLISSPGPVFSVAYWISPGAAHRNAKDPRYWSVDHPKPLIPLLRPDSNEWIDRLPSGDFIIEIDALNGHWNEYLTLTAVDGNVKQSIKVVTNEGEVFYDTEALARYRN
jgi:hypothetical protein